MDGLIVFRIKKILAIGPKALPVYYTDKIVFDMEGMSVSRECRGVEY